MRIIGEIADLVDREKMRPQVAAEAVLERACGLLAREVENRVSGGEEARRVAGQDGLVDQILSEHRLAEPVRGDDDDVFALDQKVEGQDAFDGRPMNMRGPFPFEVGDGLGRVWEPRVLQRDLQAAVDAFCASTGASASTASSCPCSR